MSIADFNTTTGWVFKNSLTDPSDLTNGLTGSDTATGTLKGNASISSDGLMCGTGGLQFTNLNTAAGDPFWGLSEYQVVMDVSWESIGFPDLGSTINGSTGFARSSNATLLTARSSTGTSGDHIRLFMTASEEFTAYPAHNSQIPQRATAIHTGGADTSYATVCLWRNSNGWGVYVNGREIHSSTNTSSFENGLFNKLVIGAGGNGTSFPFGTQHPAYIKNVAIYPTAPVITPKPEKDIVVLGDSHANNHWNQNSPNANPYRASGVVSRLPAQYVNASSETMTYYGEGDGGSSLSDSASVGNLMSANFDTWASTYNTQPNVLLVAGQNDSVGATLNDVNGVGVAGVYDNILLFANKMQSSYPRDRIIICTGSSLAGNTAVSGRDPAIREAVVSESRRAVDAWNASNSSPTMLFMDYHTVMGGDASANLNYQGFLNEVGNSVTAGVSPDDAHPSPLAMETLAAEVYRLLELPLQSSNLTENEQAYLNAWLAGTPLSGRDFGTLRTNADGELMGNYINWDHELDNEEYIEIWNDFTKPAGRDFGTIRIDGDGLLRGNYIHTDFPEDD